MAVALVWVLPLAPLLAEGTDQNANVIEVEVRGLKSGTGHVGCALFDSAAAFPNKDEQAVDSVYVTVTADRVICEFKGVARGTYAVAVLDDVNSNHKMDYNLVGIPKEPYGFSNNVRPRLGAPSFRAASFPYEGGRLRIIVYVRKGIF